MELKPKYNIGNTIWMFDESGIKEYEINAISISLKIQRQGNTGIQQEQEITYQCSDHLFDFVEAQENEENVEWFRTKALAVNHLLESAQELGDRHTQVPTTNDELDEALSKFFADSVTTEPPKKMPKKSILANKQDDSDEDDNYIPPDPRRTRNCKLPNELSKLADELSKSKRPRYRKDFNPSKWSEGD